MWKQYSNRKFAGFFPMNSSQFPAETGQKSSGNGRKISGGNTASGMNRNFAGSHQFLPYMFDPGSEEMLNVNLFNFFIELVISFVKLLPSIIVPEPQKKFKIYHVT